MRYLEGADITPKTVKQARELVGKRVKWVSRGDIDYSGCGYFFPQSGTVEEALGKNIMISGNWYWIPSLVEMVEIAE